MTALTFYIMPAQTTLYSTDLSAIVELPAGYFLLKNDNYAPDGYISVMYDDISGYVKTDEVTAVDYTPVYKYETTVRFDCDNDGQPVNVRKAPSRAAEILTVLPANGSGRCYGSIEGDALISGAGNTWYYVETGGVRGYCYYAHISVPPTPPNVIEKEPPTGQTSATEVEQKEDEASMPAVAAVIFIVALCIPVPFIMFYLFRKPKDE